MKKWYALVMVACPLLSLGTVQTESGIEVWAGTPAEVASQPSREEEEALSQTAKAVLTRVWEDLEVPSGARDFKAQESYRALKNPGTRQWQLQQEAWTDEAGFRRWGSDGHYMVAMGSYYVPSCGEILRITLDSGKTFTAVAGDQKANQHTDSKNQYCKQNGSLVEFIVDLDRISKESRRRGDMSFSSGMRGKIVRVERLVQG